MEFYKTTARYIQYPVGLCMNHNIPNINILCDDLLKAIRNRSTKPDANTIQFWCAGSSGAIIAGIMANFLYSNGITPVRINYVRKNEELPSSHENGHCNHNPNDLTIFVDDIISSGTTYRRVRQQLRQSTNLIDFDIVVITGIIDESLVPSTSPVIVIAQDYRYRDVAKEVDPDK